MPFLLGAHTSAAGGLCNALLEAQSIGATVTQYFTANQRQWRSKELSDTVIADWEKEKATTGIQWTVSHASYLINLCSDNEEVIGKSIDALGREIQRCHALRTSFLNFHPGSSKERSREAALDLIIQGVLHHKDLLQGSGVKLLLETTAGQGSQLGFDLHDHVYLLKGLQSEVDIGVCIDTCHSFAAGYRLDSDWSGFVDEVERTIGLEALCCLHINDSLKGRGSRVDRHAKLGEGEIGIRCFEEMMLDPRTRDIPKILETPGGPENWKNEIAYLKKIYERQV